MNPLLCRLVLVAKLAASRRFLLFGLALGVMAATAVLSSLPTYSQGVNAQRLADQINDASGTRPTFAYLFSHQGRSSGSTSWDQLAAADGYLMGEGFDQLGLPVQHRASLVESVPLRASVGSDGLGSRSLVSLSDLSDRVRLVDGDLPQPATELGVHDTVIQILVHADVAAELGISVGQRLDLRANEEAAYVGEVSGLWVPNGPSITRWVVRHENLTDRFLVHPETLRLGLDAALVDSVQNARWYAVLGGAGLTNEGVDDVIASGQRVTRTAEDLLPSVNRGVDPIVELERFRDRSASLTTILTRHSVPILALIVVYLMLVNGFVAADLRWHVNLLRRRGVSKSQLMEDALLEAAMVSVAATAAGLGLSLLVATALSKVTGFGQFSGEGFPLTLPRRAWIVAVACALASLVLQLGASMAVIARSADPDVRLDGESRLPWWQRTYLDLTLVVIGLLAALVVLRREGPSSGDALTDPSTVMLPAILAFAAGLLTVRILPFLLRVPEWLLRRSDDVSVLTSLQALVRGGRESFVPAVLLITTLAMGATSASTALTHDQDLSDSVLHEIGADASVLESDVVITRNAQGDEALELEREPLSPAAFNAIPNVVGSTRVVDFGGRATRPAGQRIPLQYVGIQPDSFGSVAFWRSDFAETPLTDLLGVMAGGAESPGAEQMVLIDRASQQRLGLRIGDPFELTVFVRDRAVLTPVVVGGVIERFPGWVPDENLLVVGNLDVLARQVGAATDYEVWLRYDAEPSPISSGSGLLRQNERRQDLEQAGANVLTFRLAAEEINQLGQRPERLGLLGLLTVTFAGSTAFSIGGFVVFAIGDLRRRKAGIGILRAMGLSSAEVGSLSVVGLGILVLVGLLVGLTAGWTMSELLVPKLLGGAPGPALPRLPTVDWGAIGIMTAALAASLGLVLGTVVWNLRRLRLFEAIKLGADQ